MNIQPVFRERACAVCLKEDRLLMVKILDSVRKIYHWMPPGGEIEPHEEPYLAAQREALEETGVVLDILPETRVTREYNFEFNELQYLTRTHFFLGIYKETDPHFDPDKVEKEIEAMEWTSLKVAFDRLSSHEEISLSVFELVSPLLRDVSGTDPVFASKK